VDDRRGALPGRPARRDARGMEPTPISYLPGAAGRAAFWRPVAERLADLGPAWCPGWPGFGDEPPDPAIRSLDGLFAWLLAHLPPGRSHLVAQSMGGALAARLAVERPERVARLVLVATTGGLDVDRLGAEDWRPAYLAERPHLPAWFVKERPSPPSAPARWRRSSGPSSPRPRPELAARPVPRRAGRPRHIVLQSRTKR
jgi:pimeloyl-ACP methyl ester carboxylesterase